MAFPHSVADKNRALWRLDTLAHALYLLILSASKPDCTHIVEQFGRPASEQRWDIRDYDA